MAGQMRDVHLRQNEKAAIVNDQRESLLALLSAPTDESITGSDFPGRSAKERTGQFATTTVANQVAQVLARRAAVADSRACKLWRKRCPTGGQCCHFGDLT